MFTTPERDSPDHNATVERLKDVRFLFIDEISMVSDPHFTFTITLCFIPSSSTQVSAELLCAIDKRLRIAHAALSNSAENELPDFGLANLIVLGDFAYVQLEHVPHKMPSHHTAHLLFLTVQAISPHCGHLARCERPFSTLQEQRMGRSRLTAVETFHSCCHADRELPPKG